MLIGSLFAGIGGLELGLERAGVGEVAWQVEIDPFARKVLAKHWPDAARYEDVTEVDFEGIERVDVLCGGFPCQDLSLAGHRAGLAGARSGLYREMVRAIRVVGPRYAVLENVADLLHRGLGTVLGDLAEVRYDAEWDCVPAGAVGAPHKRDRIFIVAHAQGERLEGRPYTDADDSTAGEDWGSQPAGSPARGRTPRRSPWWANEPDLPRVADGVPDQSHRTRVAGNAVSPQVAEYVARSWLTPA